METKKIKVTIEDIEALAVNVPIKKVIPKPEPTVDDRAIILVQALELALPHMIACKKAKMKADAEDVAATASVARIQDELRALRIDINDQRI